MCGKMQLSLTGRDSQYVCCGDADACVTHNPERHASSIQLVSGYCRQITAAEALSELQNQAVNVEGP